MFRDSVFHRWIVLLLYLTKPVWGYECWTSCEPRKGVPTYCDTIEGRCSLCTKPVCATFTAIPSECMCFCVKELPSRHYNEIDKASCGYLDPPAAHDDKEVSKGDRRSHEQQQNGNALNLPVTIAVSVLLLVIICGLLYYRRHKIMNIWKRWCRPIRANDQMEAQAESMLELNYLNSVLLTAPPPPPNIPPTASPARHTSLDTAVRGSYHGIREETDLPSPVNSQGGDEKDPGGLRHVHANDVGPRHPSAGVPGDYKLLTALERQRTFQCETTC